MLAVSFLLTGCSGDYKDNYIEMYPTLLDDSLGEWKVVDEREVEVEDRSVSVSEDEPIPTYTFLKWNLEYKDSNGEIQTFNIDNLTSVEEGLIDGAFQKLNDEMDNKMSEGMETVVEDPYIHFGELKDKDFHKQYQDIQKLYGDALLLNKVTIENVFKGRPIYTSITFNPEELDNMTGKQYEQYVEREIDRLLEEIPYLNAYVRIETENEDEDIYRFFIQGTEVKIEEDFIPSSDFVDALKEQFSKYAVLKHEE